jgi:alpha 1,2-mannosyltransferase
VPSWIDMSKVNEEMQKMKDDGVVYGDSLSYRHMVRDPLLFFAFGPCLFDACRY